MTRDSKASCQFAALGGPSPALRNGWGQKGPGVAGALAVKRLREGAVIAMHDPV
jgi:hypothetical protein